MLKGDGNGIAQTQPQIDDLNSRSNQRLFVLRNADLTLTTDQVFTKVFAGTNYVITDVIAVQKTGGATVACLGGIYTAASKGGSALVGSSQSFIGLSGAGKAVNATLASVAMTGAFSATPILSLTTGSTGAATADFFICGICVD